MKKKIVIPLIAACALSATACVSKDVVDDVSNNSTEVTTEAETKETVEETSDTAAETEATEETETESLALYDKDGIETFVDGNDEKAVFEADAKNMAEDFQTIIADKDMESVATYLNFPCYVDTMDGEVVVNNVDEFMELGADGVLTDALVSAVSEDDLSDNTISEAGLVVGSEEGRPNVIFGQDEEGNVGIVGINQ